jgi:hypothetical protein
MGKNYLFLMGLFIASRLFSQDLPQSFPSDDAYGYNWNQAAGLTIGPVKFPLNNPAGVSLLAAQPSSSKIYAASYANGKWYGTDDSYPYSKLYSFNTSNGTRTLVGTCYTLVVGMAYDWTTLSMYCIGYSSSSSSYELYRLGLTNAYIQMIATLPKSCNGLTCDDWGRLYTINVNDEYLFEINKHNGSLRAVGPLGVNIYSSCDMEFDNTDGNTYMTYFNYPYTYIAQVNLNTGAVTNIGNFIQQANIQGLAIQNQALPMEPDDIGLVNINHPVPATLLSGNEQVTIALVNYGNTSLSNIPVYYSIDGGPVVSGVFAGPIGPHSMMNFTFSQTEDLSQPLTYSIRAWTALSTDTHPANDTLSLSLSSYCDGRTKSSDAYISHVILGNLDHQSGSGINGYQDFTQYSADMFPGQAASLTVVNSSGFTADDAAGVWIDWNRNGVFGDDPLIEVTGGPEIFQASISVPPQTQGGLVRMRISILRAYYPNPCYFQENGEYEDYLINVILPDCDIGLLNIISPATSHYLGNAEEVSVHLLNYGQLPQGPFQLSYQVDSSDVVTETFEDILPSLGDTLFTFATTADLSAQGENYFLKVWITLNCDTLNGNDTLSDTIQNLYGIYCIPSSESCDSWIAQIIFNTINNVSDCGTNGYSDFTDISTTLSRGQSALLTLAPPDVPAIYDACRVFADWNQNGDFEDWETYGLNWNADGTWETGIMPPISALDGPTRIRIRYTADIIPPACGLLPMGEAEDYTLIVASSQNDLGILSITQPESNYQLGTSEQLSVIIGNYGSLPQSDFTVSYQVGDNIVISEIFDQVIDPLDTVLFTFNTTVDFSADDSSWIVKAWTQLNSDEHVNNDTATQVIENYPVTYCNAGSGMCDEYIKRFICKEIDNSSGCTQGGYHDYTSLTASVSAGEVITIEVFNDEATSYDQDSCGIWIDWNRDGDFSDEMVGVFGGPTYFYATVTVPAGVLPGPCRLRTRINYDETPSPCDISSYGEVEDYTLNIVGGNNSGEIQGQVLYDNDNENALDSVMVCLMQGSDTVATALTGSDGSYGFPDIAIGEYVIKCYSDKPWGGVNAMDGLQILRHFVEIITLSPMRSKAGDLDGNGNINAMDGLLAVRRFVGMINTFIIGDWVFEQPTVTVTGAGLIIQPVKGLCSGDVNGSFVP